MTNSKIILLPVLLLLALPACALVPSPAPVPPIQVASPEYYSRILRYNIRKRRGHHYTVQSYDIPVKIDSKTGKIERDEEDDDSSLKPEGIPLEKVTRQIDIIQFRINTIKKRLQNREDEETERSKVKEKTDGSN